MAISLVERVFKKTIDKQVKKSVSSALSAARIAQSFSWVGGLPVYNLSDTIQNINEGYCGSDDFYSIIRRIARTAAMIPLKVYKVVDDEAMKKYRAACETKSYSTKSLLKAQFLKTKALEEVAGDNPLQKLLDNPNPSYAKTEFYEGAYTFRLSTGNTYLHTPLLKFGVNANKPAEIWILPSQWTSLQVSDTWPRRVLGYRLTMGQIIEIPVEEVIHIRYFNPQYTFVGNELIGLSPLRAGAKVLARQESETDYSVNAFQNSGISGIVYNKSLGIDEAEPGVLGKMKSDFYSEASGTDNARKLLFQAGDIGYTAIGLSPVDMQVIESMKITFKKACNLFGVSDRLFNNDATGSEISVDIAYKDLYTNAALPEVYAMRDSLNLSLTPKFNDGNVKYFIDADITGVTELQDDFKDMANIYGSLPIMNPRVIAEAFGWGTDDVEDKWFIKQGYTSIEDAINGMGGIEPLPQDTANGN